MQPISDLLTINFVIHVKVRFVTVPKFLDKVRTLLALSDKRSTEVLASGPVRLCQYLVDEHILGKNSY